MPAKCGSSPRENVGIVRSTMESAPGQAQLQAAGDLPLVLRGGQFGLSSHGECSLRPVVVVQRRTTAIHHECYP